jgi:hypothetical protein
MAMVGISSLILFLVLSWYFPGTFLVLSWYFPGTFLVLSWYFPGTFLVLSWYFPGTFLGWLEGQKTFLGIQ